MWHKFKEKSFLSNVYIILSRDGLRQIGRSYVKSASNYLNFPAEDEGEFWAQTLNPDRNLIKRTRLTAWGHAADYYYEVLLSPSGYNNELG